MNKILNRKHIKNTSKNNSNNQIALEIKASNNKKENLVSFDLDRLVEEIDEHFQEISNTEENKFKKKLDVLFSTYDEFIMSRKEKLIEELTISGREVININDIPYVVQHLDHVETTNVVRSLTLFKKALLVGPAGAGKTTMVQHIADNLKLKFFKYSCSRDSSVHDFIGYKQPKSETYLETSFLECYEKGGLFLVDEYDSASPDMSIFFNGISDNSSFISIPHRDGNTKAVKHKDFYLVFCGNTWGNGSTDYVGRDFQDKALLDRFRMCKHFIDYHTALEKSLSGKYYPFMMKIREFLESKNSYLSTRNIEDMSKLLFSGVKQNKIVEILSYDMNKIDKEQFLKLKY